MSLHMISDMNTVISWRGFSVFSWCHFLSIPNCSTGSNACWWLFIKYLFVFLFLRRYWHSSPRCFCNINIEGFGQKYQDIRIWDISKYQDKIFVSNYCLKTMPYFGYFLFKMYSYKLFYTSSRDTQVLELTFWWISSNYLYISEKLHFSYLHFLNFLVTLLSNLLLQN